MGKVIALCGLICSGKSTYAEKLRQTNNAVVLNPDALMLTFFAEQLGEHYEALFEKRNKNSDDAAYFIDDAILDKCLSQFETPTSADFDIEYIFEYK